MQDVLSQSETEFGVSLSHIIARIAPETVHFRRKIFSPANVWSTFTPVTVSSIIFMVLAFRKTTNTESGLACLSRKRTQSRAHHAANVLPCQVVQVAMKTHKHVDSTNGHQNRLSRCVPQRFQIINAKFTDSKSLNKLVFRKVKCDFRRRGVQCTRKHDTTNPV